MTHTDDDSDQDRRDSDSLELSPQKPAGMDIDEQDASLLTGQVVRRTKSNFSKLIDHVIPAVIRNGHVSRRALSPSRRRSRLCSRPILRTLLSLSYAILALISLALFIGFVFLPSYTILPAHYVELREQALSSDAPGSGNPRGKKIFLASLLYDPHGELADGPWADNLLRLIHLLGPENTFLSIYENDSGDDGRHAMDLLRERTPCNHSLIVEDHLDRTELPHVTLMDGSKRVKRITYLAEIRNKALKPLRDTEVVFDKVLYLNDVFFDPLDVLNLLFSTNHDNYRAACAVDFINAFKFYDTFATRDLGGNGVGLPFFPWFAYGGDSRSHQDVVSGKDAVRVRSCWGGMVAFDAAFFQPTPGRVAPITAAEVSPANLTAPYLFRAEDDTYWEASECCLIHADIQSPDADAPEIFMNPFVRVGYSPATHSWLWLTRRFEALYTPVHYLLDIVLGFPRKNPRLHEEPWTEVEEMVWVEDQSVQDGGSFQKLMRLASHSAYCGKRSLAVMNEEYSGEVGIDSYEPAPIPPEM